MDAFNRMLPALLGALVLVLVVTLGYGWYRYAMLTDAHETLAAAKAEADAYTNEVLAELTRMKDDNGVLRDALTAERSKNSAFERQIRDIAGTVGTLEKLATTDPELLAKYSRVYFLSEHYVPAKLAPIDPAFVSDESRSLEVHADVVPELEKLIRDAADDGVTLKVASAYRSFGTQAALKGRYLVNYGAGANRFSADQGYSEHQLGTTVDFTSPAIGGALVGFETTDAYTWLRENAYKYGFVLSYPENNSYYQFEPWHWRFVGEALADRLHEDDAHFYELDQREIDEYLAELFD